MAIVLRVGEMMREQGRPGGKRSQALGAVHADAHHAAGGGPYMPVATRNVVTSRLAIAKEHLESVLRCLQKHDVHCADVLRQIRAVEGALQKADQLTLESHFRLMWGPPPGAATRRRSSKS